MVFKDRVIYVNNKLIPVYKNVERTSCIGFEENGLDSIYLFLLGLQVGNASVVNHHTSDNHIERREAKFY